MIKCPVCQKELADGSKFCDACGAKIEAVETPVVEETPVEANNIDFDATVATAPSVEAPEAEPVVNETTEEKSSAKPKMSKKMLTILGAAVAGVVALVLIIVLVAALGGGYKGYNYALYYKDGEVNYTNLPSVKSWEVSDKDGYRAALTPDGKNIVYINDSDDDRTLCIRSASKPKKAALEIKDDVTYFDFSNDSKYVIFEADGNLYEYNIAKKNSVKIKNDVEDFELFEDSDKLLYSVSDEGDVYDVYVKTIGKENDKKIVADASTFRVVDSECKEFYYVEDEDLYFAKLGKEGKEIDKDVSSISAVFEDGSVYYKKYDDEGKTSLLYYTGKGEPKEIFSDFDMITVETYAETKPVAVVSVMESYDDEESTKYVLSYGKTSTISHDDAQTFRLTEDGSTIYYLADINYEKEESNETAPMDEYSEYYDEYDYYDYEETYEDEYEGEFESATLYTAKITKKGIGKAKEYDTGVYDEISLLDDKTIVYYKEYDLEDDCGTLYVNKKKIDTEVNAIAYAFTESKNFLYGKDVKDGTATLYLCKNGKKGVKIADDVTNAAFTGKGDVIYLKDYDEEDSEGDLYFFNGNKSKLIDDEVSSFIVDYTANVYF